MEIKHPGNSRHHLFSYYEIRDKLIEIFGEPKTDEEHIFIQKKTTKIRSRMPLYGLSDEFHQEIHKVIK
ncbi:hypothetical protein KA005_04035 [bacterium]|nr:hypothetical protein [bacterium]